MPSKTAPKIPVPFADEPGAVFMTAPEWEAFKTRLGEACALYWCEQADNYAAEWPARWRRYKNHSRTLLNWHMRRIADGYEFFTHPKHGPNYYKPWVIKAAEASA